MVQLPVDRVGTHVTHCCVIHGCKYGNPDCPVVLGDEDQEFLCEECDTDGIESIESIKAMKTLGLKKCPECGHYYKKKDLKYPIDGNR